MLNRSSARLQGAATFGNTTGRQTIPYCNARNSSAAVISRHANNTPPFLPRALFLQAEFQTKIFPQSQFSQQFLLRNLCLKPLHLIPRSRRAVRVEAKIEDEAKCEEFREGASGAVIHQNEDPRDTCSRRLKVALYFAVWWTLNVSFNIYNKKVLSVFPFPWLASWLCLAGGSSMMLFVWTTGLVEPPKTDLSFWKALLPVALAHTVGHVAATISMSRVAMAFTHIIKCAEPAVSVLIQSLFLREQFPWPVYLSLVPIVAGCCLSAITELEFDLTGFLGAMISSVAFVFRNLLSKKAMKIKSIGGINYYACLCLESLVLLTPLAVAAEGPQLWSSGWEKAVQQIGPQFVWYSKTCCMQQLHTTTLTCLKNWQQLQNATFRHV
ncbi:hypothetical protein O6H91_22G058000 [Diphasiastrum complanatum]|uniref:Uncharacterized protein n=1 Tax=Diphasiastrum complanatum TaxID=34168 RepID=A0ACC2AFS4_DIPCM|nr:hypothetical protein O6H91_22G058000 [Diphasiastrum complanatum]